jgi:hypothetical protein
MTFGTRFTRTIFVGLALGLASASAAQALDGYWHGILSNDWNDGLAGDASNWFDMAPPNGDAVDVPDGTAIFAPGAQTMDVVVNKLTQIKKVEFTAGNDAYTIFVTSKGGLTISGAGVSNVSAVAQTFSVDGKSSLLTFRNDAEAGIPGAGALPVTIVNKDRGETRFKGKSSASDAEITNEGGKLRFDDKSSAGSAKLTNNHSKSEIHFLDKATGGSATIQNVKGAVLFKKTNRKSVPVKKIVNKSRLIVGPAKVAIANTLKLTKSATLNMDVGTKKKGRIDAKGRVAGRFAKTILKRFGNKLDASIVYQGRRVLLDVRAK